MTKNFENDGAWFYHLIVILHTTYPKPESMDFHWFIGKFLGSSIYFHLSLNKPFHRFYHQLPTVDDYSLEQCSFKPVTSQLGQEKKTSLRAPKIINTPPNKTKKMSLFLLQITPKPSTHKTKIIHPGSCASFVAPFSRLYLSSLLHESEHISRPYISKEREKRRCGEAGSPRDWTTSF